MPINDDELKKLADAFFAGTPFLESAKIPAILMRLHSLQSMFVVHGMSEEEAEAEALVTIKEGIRARELESKDQTNILNSDGPQISRSTKQVAIIQWLLRYMLRQRSRGSTSISALLAADEMFREKFHKTKDGGRDTRAVKLALGRRGLCLYSYLDNYAIPARPWDFVDGCRPSAEEATLEALCAKFGVLINVTNGANDDT